MGPQPLQSWGAGSQAKHIAEPLPGQLCPGVLVGCLGPFQGHFGHGWSCRRDFCLAPKLGWGCCDIEKLQGGGKRYRHLTFPSKLFRKAQHHWSLGYGHPTQMKPTHAYHWRWGRKCFTPVPLSLPRSILSKPVSCIHSAGSCHILELRDMVSEHSGDGLMAE